MKTAAVLGTVAVTILALVHYHLTLVADGVVLAIWAGYFYRRMHPLS